MRICILIGSPDISGGTYVIFEHALHLQSVGVDVTIVPLTPVSRITTRWHRGLEQLAFKTLEEAANVPFDLAMATWWKTVYELHRIDARQYCHFAQSIESWFYPDHEVALRNLANAVHLFGLPTLTEASWIAAHLHKKFGISSHLIPNGCDKQLFRSDVPAEAPPDNHRLRVLVEGPLGVDFKNVARTIALLRKSRADEIWLLTLSAINFYPGVSRVWSQLSVTDCPRIYRSCDLIVKLSYIEGMFGPPLEMFHCGGTAVVYDVPGHEEYIDPGRNAIVVPLGDEAAAIAAVDRLKNDLVLRAHLKEGARETAARWPDWPEVGTRFHRALLSIMNEKPPVARNRIAFIAEELRCQYLRVEKALVARGWTPSQGLRSAARSLANVIAVRSPAAERFFRITHARLIESRFKPAPRTRI